MIKASIFCVLMFLLIGCSSVDQPIARVALVDKSQVHHSSTLPEELWAVLANARSGTAIELGQEVGTLGDGYQAASGKYCRKVSIDMSLDRIVCKANQDQSWVLVNPILAAANQQQVLNKASQ